MNRIILNETSYYGAGCRVAIADEIKKRGFKKVLLQIVCIGVVWAWSRVFAGMIEVASMRGLLTWPVKRGTIRHIVSGEEPVVATTRLGRVLFWTTTVAMLLVLLSFSFWGLFLF